MKSHSDVRTHTPDEALKVISYLTENSTEKASAILISDGIHTGLIKKTPAYSTTSTL